MCCIPTPRLRQRKPVRLGFINLFINATVTPAGGNVTSQGRTSVFFSRWVMNVFLMVDEMPQTGPLHHKYSSGCSTNFHHLTPLKFTRWAFMSFYLFISVLILQSSESAEFSENRHNVHFPMSLVSLRPRLRQTLRLFPIMTRQLTRLMDRRTQYEGQNIQNPFPEGSDAAALQWRRIVTV